MVFLVGMEEGFLPHKKSIFETFDIDEERRLCYVGFTRAEKRLVLLGARQRRKYGKLEQREPSRFISEIPQGFLNQRQPDQPLEASPEQEAASASSFFSNMSKLFGE